MSVKDFLKNSRIILYFRILHEKLQEVGLLTKYIANGNRLNDKNKLLTDLAIRTHAIEKGMSIGSVRVGFGQPKTMSLLHDLQRYLTLGGSKDFVSESCSVINKYITFNEDLGADMTAVKAEFDIFCKENKIDLIDKGGIYFLDKNDTVANQKSSFDIFSRSRFSVRDFGTSKIPVDCIERALSLAEKTPSRGMQSSPPQSGVAGWRRSALTGITARTMTASASSAASSLLTKFSLGGCMLRRYSAATTSLLAGAARGMSRCCKRFAVRRESP